MNLVAEVLANAAAAAYLVEDTSAGPRVWRASGALDARRELPLLEQASRDDAAMVVQLLERGWLQRAGRRHTPAAEQRGKSSGRRRFDVAAHPLTVPATTRHRAVTSAEERLWRQQGRTYAACPTDECG